MTDLTPTDEPRLPREPQCGVCGCGWHGLPCTARRYVQIADWRAYGKPTTYRREECGCLGEWADAKEVSA